MKIVISTKWLGRLDTWGHRLRVPQFLLRPICNAYDARLIESSWGAWPKGTYMYISGDHPPNINYTSSSNVDVKYFFKGGNH